MSLTSAQDFWTRVIADSELKGKITVATEGKPASELAAAISEAACGEGFGFTPEELVATQPLRATQQLSEAELNQVAGGGTNENPTTYVFIPGGSLPLLDPLKTIPNSGTPLTDLVEPTLTVLVNMGYGDPAGQQNVPSGPGLPAPSLPFPPK